MATGDVSRYTPTIPDTLHATGIVDHGRQLSDIQTAFEHEVEIEVLGIGFSALVLFAQDAGFTRSVIGRNVWLNHLRVGLIDYDRMLYLSPYDA